MNQEIILIRKFFDEIECRYKYEILIETNDKPKLKIGEVEIKQK